MVDDKERPDPVAQGSLIGTAKLCVYSLVVEDQVSRGRVTKEKLTRKKHRHAYIAIVVAVGRVLFKASNVHSFQTSMCRGILGVKLTCQLVSTGRPEICIRKGVRLGRGAARSWCAKLSLRRGPRANWTTKRSPMKSEPWKAGTTSRASMASLYSMKPKPFMSLISVISPVP